MSNAITAAELELIAKLKTLPQVPQVRAASMLYAQGVKFTDGERQTIRDRKAIFAQLGMPGRVTVPVFDFGGARIGELIF